MAETIRDEADLLTRLGDAQAAYSTNRERIRDIIVSAPSLAYPILPAEVGLVTLANARYPYGVFERFGATGGADDTTAVKNALLYGGPVTGAVPGRVYSANISELTMPVAKTFLHHVTLQQLTHGVAGTVEFLKILGADCIVEDVEIIGNRATDTGTVILLSTRSALRPKIRRVRLTNASYDGLFLGGTGGPGTETIDALVEDVETYNCARNGIAVTGAIGFQIIRPIARNTNGLAPGAGILCERSGTAVVENGLIDRPVTSGNAGSGVQLAGPAVSNVHTRTIDADGDSTGFEASGVVDCTLDGGVIRNCPTKGGYVHDAGGIGPRNVKVRGVHFKANFRNYEAEEIATALGADCELTDCLLEDATEKNVRINVTSLFGYHRNISRNAGTIGADFNKGLGTACRPHITDSVFEDNDEQGLRLQAAVDFQIEGGSVKGNGKATDNTYAQIQISGSGAAPSSGKIRDVTGRLGVNANSPSYALATSLDTTVDVQGCDFAGGGETADTNFLGTVTGFERKGSTTYNPPSLNTATEVITTITVTGAKLGDFIEVTFSLDLQGIVLSWTHTPAGTINVKFRNDTGGTINLAEGQLRHVVRSAA